MPTDTEKRDERLCEAEAVIRAVVDKDHIDIGWGKAAVMALEYERKYPEAARSNPMEMNPTSNYNPNITRRMNKQAVKLTLAMWEYRTERTVTVNSNCSGLEVIKAAVRVLYESLAPDPEDCPMIPLEAHGDTLTCEDDEERGEDWLEEMVIAAEILSLEESK